MATNSTPRLLIAIVIVAVLGIAAYAFMTMPDQRSTGERVGDAVDALPNSPDRAVRQLGDQTPAEKAGEAIKNTGDDLRR